MGTTMIDVNFRHGRWQNHDWYLLCDRKHTGHIFYAPTLRLALLLTDSLGEIILTGSELPELVLDRLRKHSHAPVFPETGRPQVFHLAIGLTNNCTLACDYCHAEADRDTQTTHELIERSIEHAFQEGGKTPKKRMSVSFAVGGEPTMNWKEFVSTVDKIRNHERLGYCGVEKVFLSMTTNCYYGNEKREYVADNFDTLTLSIDGDEEIQNMHRPTRGHKGSYGLVAETIKYFIDSSKVAVGLRGTVSSISAPRMVNIIEHYHAVFGAGYTVSFEPLIEIGRALNGTLAPPSNEEFALNYWAARERGRGLGIRVITSAANIDRLVGRYCGAMSIPSFTVCTNGKITACHRDQDGMDYVYGQIDVQSKKIEIDKAKIQANILQTELPDYCTQCFAKWHCAGDCPDIRRIGYSRCDINRYVIYNQLHELLTRGGELKPQCVTVRAH